MRQMTSRERVHAAAKGLPFDRVPVMYYLNSHLACRLMADFFPARSRFWNTVAPRLWRRFIEGGELDAGEWARALPLLLTEYADGRYALELGADLAFQSAGLSLFAKRFYRENGYIRVADSFGSVRGIGGIYLDVIQPAIKDARDLKNLPLPDLTAPKHYAPVRKLRKEHPGASILLEVFGAQDLFCSQLWEMSQFMLALYDHPDEVKDFQRRFADWSIDIARRGVEAGADIVLIYDDYGYTNRPLISMEMWLEFTYPHLKRLINAIHDAGALVMLHSCGFQMSFLEYYVEAGLDILQSFQPKAGNDFEAAYAQYGDRLAFATGIDVQQGERMTPQEIRADILRNYRIGGRNGRHILGMTHMMQYTMPAKNIQTIFDTVREIQAGAHD